MTPCFHSHRKNTEVRGWEKFRIGPNPDKTTNSLRMENKMGFKTAGLSISKQQDSVRVSQNS